MACYPSFYCTFFPYLIENFCCSVTMSTVSQAIYATSALHFLWILLSSVRWVVSSTVNPCFIYPVLLSLMSCCLLFLWYQVPLASTDVPMVFLSFTLIASCEQKLLILWLFVAEWLMGKTAWLFMLLQHCISFEYCYPVYVGLLAQLSIMFYLPCITVTNVLLYTISLFLWFSLALPWLYFNR